MFQAPRIGRLLWLPMLLALLLGALASPAQAAQQLCFPETGFCIEERFAAYWQQNGGLPVFGFPIGPAQQEVNRETGQSYLTQWFERNRFELHPENRAPYDVLLGRLGDDLLRTQGIDWQLTPRESGPRQGCRWFEQTGHNICDQAPGLGFKTYWETHGLRDDRLDAGGRSLALFGLPLTEARVETNPADGQPYLTQWFERARVEWHPEKENAYKVLLGLLGNEARASAAKIAEQVTGRVIGSSGALYWIEAHNGLSALYGLDIAGNRKVAVSGRPDLSVMPAAGGDSIAWVERSPDSLRQYVMMNTIFARIGLPPRILLESGGGLMSQIASIALDGGALYYVDSTPGHVGLYARNLDTGAEELIAENGVNPVAADGTLLWSTYTDNGQTGAANRGVWTLHLRELARGADRVVITVGDLTAGVQAEYAVSGGNVVWSIADPGVDSRVFLYRISDNRSVPISTDAAGGPRISGATVAWVTNPFISRDPALGGAVQTYDIATGAIKTIARVQGGWGLRSVAFAGGRLAFTGNPSQQTGLWLYLASLS
jgi:hypothetical protein